MPEIKLEGISVEYAGGNRINYPDMCIPTGTHGLILGKSGSGKTTLLHLIAGLTAPTSGKLWVGEQDLTRLSQSEMDSFRGQHIGIVFQQAHLILSLTVYENLLLPPFFAKKNTPAERIHELAERLGITDILTKSAYKISQGQAQRVAIARALLNQPVLILADEPTSSLDDDNAHEVVRLLRHEATQLQASLIISTHDQRLTNEIDTILTLT